MPPAPSALQWWEVPPHAKGVKWHYLEHTGVYFPPAYVPHGVKILYDNVAVDLTPEQEEMATFFAAVGKEAPQLKVRRTLSPARVRARLSCAPDSRSPVRDASALRNPQDPDFRKTFCINFWKDFKKALGHDVKACTAAKCVCATGHVVKDFNKIDFDGIRAHLARKSELKKSASKEEKDRASSLFFRGARAPCLAPRPPLRRPPPRAQAQSSTRRTATSA